MKYAWREAAKQNPQLKLDDLRRTFDTFYNSLRPENVNGQSAEESREICSRMCQKTNTTFCWSEMKCKQEGAQCSLKHLAKMMNKTAFEEQYEVFNHFHVIFSDMRAIGVYCHKY